MDNFSSLKDLVINIPNLRGCRLNLPIPVISSFDLAVETTHFLYYIKAKIKREKKEKEKGKLLHKTRLENRQTQQYIVG